MQTWNLKDHAERLIEAKRKASPAMDGDPPQMQAPAAGNMYNKPWYTYTWRCWTRNSRHLTMVGETLNDISTAATEPISLEKVSSESLKSSPKKIVSRFLKIWKEMVENRRQR